MRRCQRLSGIQSTNNKFRFKNNSGLLKSLGGKMLHRESSCIYLGSRTAYNSLECRVQSRTAGLSMRTGCISPPNDYNSKFNSFQNLHLTLESGIGYTVRPFASLGSWPAPGTLWFPVIITTLIIHDNTQRMEVSPAVRHEVCQPSTGLCRIVRSPRTSHNHLAARSAPEARETLCAE